MTTRTLMMVFSILMLSTDLCALIPNPPLAELADCDAAGLKAVDMCGPSAICLHQNDIPAPNLACIELCRPSVAPGLEQTNHPDCSRPDAVCTSFYAFQGVCL